MNNSNTTSDKISRINELQESIRKLKYFTLTVDSHKNGKCGLDKYSISAILKVKTEKSFSVFAKRHYGFGEHVSEIQVPNEFIEELEYLSLKRLQSLEKELNDLLK